MKRTITMAACAAAALCTSSMAQTTNWTNPAGGTFSAPTNWSAGVPISTSQAKFSLPGAYTVSFDGSATVGQTSIDLGVVTFALGGRDLTTGSLVVSPFSGNPGSPLPLLRLSNGRVMAGTASLLALEVVNAAQINATSTTSINRFLTVNGVGSTFTGNITLGGSIAGSGSSMLAAIDVLNGGLIALGSSFTAGDITGSYHEITVDGANSSFALSGFTLGQSGSASLVVSNGGAVKTNPAFSNFGTFRAATSSVSTASILIDGGTMQFSEISLGGSSATSTGATAGSATMIVRNGGVVQSGSSSASSSTTLAIFSTSSLDLDDGTLRGTGNVRVEGFLRGSGLISQALINWNTGRVLVAAGKRLRNGSTSLWTNNGLMTLDNGSQLDAGLLNNEPGALLTARNGATIENRTTANRGSVAFTAGHVDVLGRFDNILPNSVVTLSNGATATFYDDVMNFGRINLNAGSVATFLGSYTATGAGTITGSGTATFEGDLRPSSPAGIGTLLAGGDLNLGAASTLRIKLGGLQRGSEYDTVDVGGTVGFDGSIHVSRINGFVPLPGDAFEIARFAASTGDVAIINATGFAGLSFTKASDAMSLTLVASATGGDANLDAIVNFDDLVTLAQNYGIVSGANWLEADFTHDGGVGFDDLVLLAQNYGGTAGEFAGDWALAQSLVPEPATIAALLSVCAVFTRRRRGN
jgi:T5SS/PEP-CTERM-associated repeat protein